MTRFEKFQRYSVMFSIIILLILTISPSVGWITRKSGAVLFKIHGGNKGEFSQTDYSLEYIVTKDVLQKLLKEQGSDIEIAFGVNQMLCVAGSPSGAKEDSRKPLVNFCDQHPNYLPGLATLVRLRSSGEVKINRDEANDIAETIKSVGTSTSNSKLPAKLSDPMMLADYDNLCARGERLDPKNAFFPTMRAIGLFEAHRDEEAWDALDRSARMTVWNEYTDVEIKCRLKVQRQLEGDLSAIDKTNAAFSVLMPHYANIRSMSRLVTNIAIQRERAGDFEGGLKARQGIQRISANMRVNSRSIIGPLVSLAILQVASMRPGGAPPPIKTQNVAINRVNHIVKYVKYLKEHGHADEAEWVNNEFNAGNSLRAIYTAYGNTPAGSFTSFYRLVILLAAIKFLLAYVFWSLFFALVSHLYLNHLKKRQKNGFKSHDKFVTASSFVLFSIVLLTVGSQHVSVLSRALAEVTQMSGNPMRGVSESFFQIVVAVALFGTPLFLLCVSAIYALARRKPFGKETANWMRPTGIISALLLTSTLAVILGYTASEEKKQSKIADAIIINETQNAAKTVGKPVPGFVIAPPIK